MDEVDHAQKYNETFLAACLSRPRSRRAAGGESLKNCRECGEPIPEKRRQCIPGCELCIDCRREEEKRT